MEVQMVHFHGYKRAARAHTLRHTTPASALSYMAFALAVGFAIAVVFGLIG
jgi:hypothetical protein